MINPRPPFQAMPRSKLLFFALMSSLMFINGFTNIYQSPSISSRQFLRSSVHHLLISESAAASKKRGNPRMGKIPQMEAVCAPPTFLSLSSPQSKLTVRRFKHSKMWKSDRINIPKYLAEDVDICRMQELLKREDERMERLKEELKMLRRRQFNFFISSSTIGQKRGG